MPVLAFGPFTLDPRSGELRRDDGEVVTLPPQPLRLLLALAERSGQLVTREELRQKVWDEGTFVDHERGLNFCVLQVRTALGDDAKNPRYIETLPKRGYRLIAPCTVAAPAVEPPARVKRSLYPMVAASALVILLVLAWDRRASAPAPQALNVTSPVARDAYLRGRQLWQERTTPALTASAAAMREAIRAEPGFVLAHIGLAESLHALAMRDRIAPREAAPEIRKAAESALRLAPSFARSHSTAAMLHFWYEWDWDAAEASYRRAIALDPGESGALHDHGWLLIVRGAWDEGSPRSAAPRSSIPSRRGPIRTWPGPTSIHVNMRGPSPRLGARWPSTPSSAKPTPASSTPISSAATTPRRWRRARNASAPAKP